MGKYVLPWALPAVLLVALPVAIHPGSSNAWGIVALLGLLAVGVFAVKLLTQFLRHPELGARRGQARRLVNARARVVDPVSPREGAWWREPAEDPFGHEGDDDLGLFREDRYDA